MGPELTADLPTRLLVWISAPVVDHVAALRARVAHPDRLDVVAATHTPAEVRAAQDTLTADVTRHPSLFRSYSGDWTPGQAVVTVELAPGQAARLQRR